MLGRIGSVQAQDILHAVNAGSLADHPIRGPKRSLGKRVATAGLVGQFDPLPHRGEEDGVVSHHIAAAHRVNTNFRGRAGADDAVPTVAQRVVQLDLADIARISNKVVAVPLGASFLSR